MSLTVHIEHQRVVALVGDGVEYVFTAGPEYVTAFEYCDAEERSAMTVFDEQEPGWAHDGFSTDPGCSDEELVRQCRTFLACWLAGTYYGDPSVEVPA